MKALRRWLKSFLSLSGSQANGLMVLLPLLFLFIVSEPVWRWWQLKHWEPEPGDIVMLDSLAKAWQKHLSTTRDSFPSSPAPRYAPFDPNRASVADLVEMGFSERMAHRIENYRKKGGVFRSSQDLLKIYGMDTAQYQRVSSYVVIHPEYGDRPPKPARRNWETRERAAVKNDARLRKLNEPFDLNLADTARLEAVRGIGQKLSRRIIKYRSSLGGFVQVWQLKEVFGLDSVTLTSMMEMAFVAPDFLPDRIDLNRADEKRLEAHPYISRQEARAIVAYRFQHGRFTSVSDLRKLGVFSDEKVTMLEAYLKID